MYLVSPIYTIFNKAKYCIQINTVNENNIVQPKIPIVNIGNYYAFDCLVTNNIICCNKYPISSENNSLQNMNVILDNNNLYNINM